MQPEQPDPTCRQRATPAAPPPPPSHAQLEQGSGAAGPRRPRAAARAAAGGLRRLVQFRGRGSPLLGAAPAAAAVACSLLLLAGTLSALGQQQQQPAAQPAPPLTPPPQPQQAAGAAAESSGSTANGSDANGTAGRSRNNSGDSSSGGGNVYISEVMASNQGAVVLPAATAGGKGAGGSGAGSGGGGSSPDWIELHNSGGAAVTLKGWKLRLVDGEGGSGSKSSSHRDASGEGDGGSSWPFPADTSVPANSYLVIYASGKNASSASATASSPAPLHTSFKLPAEGGVALELEGPDGVVVSRVQLPRQYANVSFGVPAADIGGVQRDPAAAPPLTYLSSPTPGADNAAPLAIGPIITSVSRPTGSTRPPAGADLPINITLRPNLNAIDGGRVSLVFVVNWGQEQELAAAQVGQAGPDGELVFAAAIPAAAFKAGDMVRWRARAADTAGYRAAFPRPPPAAGAAATEEWPAAVAAAAAAAASASKPEEEPQPHYYGTAIAPPEDQIITPDVPILEWFSPDEAAATTVDGAGGQVLVYGATLYDNVAARRRGVTALSWPKPKLKFTLPQQDFKYSEEQPEVSEFGLQSFWYELGERSYMKEPLALQFMREAGVIAPTSFHVHVRLNGAFYGLFAFVEVLDDTYLERHGLPASGPLFKSVSGELSNLRWDLPLKEYPSFWEKENRDNVASDWEALRNFSRGLAGGGPLPRSEFVVQSVNLPSMINNMAAQTLVNNMDRCTKNFFMYLHPHTREWYMLPWDMDGSFGQDNGLGGKPGLDNYCVLACEQWNSPLYCDSEHPQDLSRVTPWGSVSVKLNDNAYQGAAVRKPPPPSAAAGRRSRALLLQQQDPEAAPEEDAAGGGGASATAPEAAAAPATGASPAARRARRRAEDVAATINKSPMYAAGPTITKFPSPRGWDDPDRATLTDTSSNGPAGTYNHLYDAILDTNATRSMYLRRLRTLADSFLASGRIAQMANETYTRIKPLADLDAKKWSSGISIDRGYKQITTEFLPVRTDQLLGSLYGPTGRRSLLPTSQQREQIALVTAEPLLPGEAAPPAPAVTLRLRNKGPDAIDLSGWRLRPAGAGVGAVNLTFPAGTVVAPSSSVVATTDLGSARDLQRRAAATATLAAAATAAAGSGAAEPYVGVQPQLVPGSPAADSRAAREGLGSGGGGRGDGAGFKWELVDASGTAAGAGSAATSQTKK
ncbi:hypothetical protein HYH02_002201 [Chlamydomonas schloesseri]|uniref:LTD domain-containing protein n=1 Tax=Chlamydomonas schloesseri TaxID=2026947 RepID=A0A836BAP7_9CHLO|nr:hypothetical protein HYH02_002201 [Chlamydomonas schloesseri]|eukprot:KAG2452857.1 hypothetical protein HYH02_002201 [Chlamydomonas schloesseri]